MKLYYYPEVRSEAGLPIYVTGIGVDFEQKDTARPLLENPHLIITTDGRGKISVYGKEYTMGQGSVLFINREIEYDIQPITAGWRIDWLSFEYGLGELPAGMFTSQNTHFWEFGAHCEYSSVMRSIYESLTVDSSYGGYSASAELYRMIIKLNRETSAGSIIAAMNPAVCAAITYINEHYTEEIMLERLCSVAGGLSEQYLCRLFKQSTGMRPVEYILKKRITAARALLETTDIPIPEIAAQTGFHNTSYFYRNFKKFIGTSPLTCRQKAIAEKE